MARVQATWVMETLDWGLVYRGLGACSECMSQVEQEAESYLVPTPVPAISVTAEVRLLDEVAEEGSSIEYRVVATNSAVSTLTGPDFAQGNRWKLKPYTITWPDPLNPYEIAPGESVIFTILDTLIQDEVDAGLVSVEDFTVEAWNPQAIFVRDTGIATLELPIVVTPTPTPTPTPSPTPTVQPTSTADPSLVPSPGASIPGGVSPTGGVTGGSLGQTGPGEIGPLLMAVLVCAGLGRGCFGVSTSLALVVPNKASGLGDGFARA